MLGIDALPFSTIDTRLLITIGAIGIVAFGLLAAISRKLGVKLPATTISWKSFLQGQGTILLCFLVLGAGIGWLSTKYLSVETSQTADQIRLVEYRQLDLSGQPVYENFDTSGYTYATVYAKSNAPQGSTMSIQVIPEQDQQKAQSAVQLQGTDVAWSRLEEPLAARRLTLIISGSGASGARATSADVLVFLNKK